MNSTSATRAGGIALIGGAIAFMGVFAYLAASFNYPEILDGAAADVLPRLLATGSAGRAAWSFYALLPLIWIPAGVGAFQAYRRCDEGSMRTAQTFSVIAALSMMVGLMRWPSLHWHLAGAGILTAVAGLIGMLRNLTPLVQPVAEVNNYLLPIWMIIFGVQLLRHRPAAD